MTQLVRAQVRLLPEGPATGGAQERPAVAVDHFVGVAWAALGESPSANLAPSGQSSFASFEKRYEKRQNRQMSAARKTV